MDGPDDRPPSSDASAYSEVKPLFGDPVEPVMEEDGSFLWTLHRGINKSKHFWFWYSAVWFYIVIDLITGIVGLTAMAPSRFDGLQAAQTVCASCEVASSGVTFASFIMIFNVVPVLILGMFPWLLMPRYNFYATAYATTLTALVTVIVGVLVSADAFVDEYTVAWHQAVEHGPRAACSMMAQLSCNGWDAPCSTEGQLCPSNCSATTNTFGNVEPTCQQAVRDIAHNYGWKAAAFGGGVVFLQVKQFLFMMAFVWFYRREMRRAKISPCLIPKLRPPGSAQRRGGSAPHSAARTADDTRGGEELAVVSGTA